MPNFYLTISIEIKRAYEPATSESDGARILVDRLWPRGISKEKAQLDLWDKDIAPSPEIRKWWNHVPGLYSEFAQKYRTELDDNPEAVDALVDFIVEYAIDNPENPRITLVYGAKDPVVNHAHILRDYMRGVLVDKGITEYAHEPEPLAAESFAGVEIKQCSVADLSALQSLQSNAFEETFASTNSVRNMDDFLASAYNNEEAKKDFKRHNSITYLAVDKYSQQPVGYITMNWGSDQSEPDYPEDFEIQRLYILKKYKGLHIGSTLMNLALDIARREGYQRVWLGVWEHNEPAKKFYTKFGFTQISSHVFVMGDDPQIDLIMQKTL